MVIAWLVVKGAWTLLHVVSKDVLQSHNALLQDLKQLGFFDW